MYKILVEGNTDKHLVYHLAKIFDVNLPKDNISAKPDSVEKLISSIPIVLKEPNLHSLGIIVDADESHQNRWEQIKSKLISFGYRSLPERPSSDGLFFSDDNLPNVGVWIWPNNMSAGMLEDFFLSIIKCDDEILKETELSLNRMEENRISRYKIIHRSKAKTHTWLAWQDEPGRPIGLSSEKYKSYLDLENNNLKILINWIKRIVNTSDRTS